MRINARHRGAVDHGTTSLVLLRRNQDGKDLILLTNVNEHPNTNAT